MPKLSQQFEKKVRNHSFLFPHNELLNYITPLDNLTKILSSDASAPVHDAANPTDLKPNESTFENGILSHERAQANTHIDISNQDVQRRRENKLLPNGKTIHQCANLYINARNAMMFQKSHENLDNLCVLRVKYDVIDLPNVVISNKNAAAKDASFFTPIEALAKLDFEKIFSESWAEEEAGENLKQIMMAEVLIPDKVDNSMIDSILVGSEKAKERVQAIANSTNFHGFIGKFEKLFFVN